jgi:hypothetical protein
MVGGELGGAFQNSGSADEAVVVFRDITLRRRTEDQLRAALTEVERLEEQPQLEKRTLRAVGRCGR